MNDAGSRLEPSQFLSGWKDIARYLGKGVRTVQRYERDLGLPVSRPAGKAHGSVLATRQELDAWIHASPIREGFQLATRSSHDNTAATATMKSGLAEMSRLREQLMALRAEVTNSVSLLHNSVYGLCGELNQLRRKPADPLTLAGGSPKNLLSLLVPEKTRRKAS